MREVRGMNCHENPYRVRGDKPINFVPFQIKCPRLLADHNQICTAYKACEGGEGEYCKGNFLNGT